MPCFVYLNASSGDFASFQVDGHHLGMFSWLSGIHVEDGGQPHVASGTSRDNKGDGVSVAGNSGGVYEGMKVTCA